MIWLSSVSSDKKPIFLMSLAYSESVKCFYVSQSMNTNAAIDSTGTEKLTSFVSLGRKLIMTIEM